MHYRLFLLWLTLLQSGSIQILAQYAGTRLYTNTDGLPVTEVHAVAVDRSGNLLATFPYGGLQRYDGHTFQPFNKERPLSGTKIEVDQEGGVWLIHTAGLTYILGDSISQWSYQTQDQFTAGGLIDTAKSGKSIPRGGLIQSSDGGVYLYYRSSNKEPNLLYRFLADKQMWVLRDSFSYDSLIRHVRTLAEKNPSVSTSQLEVLTGIMHKNGLPASFKDKKFAYSAHYFLPLINPGYCLRMTNDRLEEVVFQPAIATLGNIQHVRRYFHAKGDRWCFVLDAGNIKHLYEFDADGKQVMYCKFKSPSNILFFAKDDYNTYWMATHEGLLRVFPQFTHFFWQDNEKIPTGIHALVESKSGKLWFGSYGKGLGYIQNDQVHRLESHFPPDLKFLPGAAQDEDGRPLMITSSSSSFSHTGIIRINEAEFTLEKLTPYFQGFFLGYTPRKDLLYGSSGEGMFVKQGNCFADSCWQQIDNKKGLQFKNVLSAFADEYGRYWMTHPNLGWAVYLPEQDTVYNFLKRPDNSVPFTLATLRDVDKALFAGSKQGIVRFEPPKELSPTDTLEDWISYLDTTLQADQQFVGALAGYNNEFLAYTSNQGFHLLNKNSLRPDLPLPTILNFDQRNGYTGGGGDQNTIWVNADKQDIWVANDQGISRINMDLLNLDKEPAILLVEQVGGIFPSDLSKPIPMSMEKESIAEVKYQVQPSLDPFTDVYFQYQLDDGPVRVTRNTSLQFSKLNYGKHKLKLQGFRNGVPTKREEIVLKVPFPFYFTPLFLTLVSLLAGTAFFSIRSLINEWRNEQRKMSKLRVKNLVDNLSPHFLGNSFNWIQNRAKLNNDQVAADIIKKMDNITTSIFLNSRKNKVTHSLREELMLLRDYFAIQRVRYGAKQQYHIREIDPDLPIDEIQIPMMTLQLLCDNAIEHGLQKQKDGAGNVWVSVQREYGGVCIFIEDDGIGRKKAAEMATTGFGESTRMLREMIAELNRHNRSKFELHYEDDIFHPNQGSPHGTRCILFIPNNYQYEISD